MKTANCVTSPPASNDPESQQRQHLDRCENEIIEEDNQLSDGRPSRLQGQKKTSVIGQQGVSGRSSDGHESGCMAEVAIAFADYIKLPFLATATGRYPKILKYVGFFTSFIC